MERILSMKKLIHDPFVSYFASKRQELPAAWPVGCAGIVTTVATSTSMPTSTPTSTAVRWIPCRGWFSERPHDGTAWIGVAADGRVARIDEMPPASGERLLDVELSTDAVPLLADTHVHVY